MAVQQPEGEGQRISRPVVFSMPAVEAYVALDAPHQVELVFYNLPAEGVETQGGQRVTVTMSATSADMLFKALQKGMRATRTLASGGRRRSR